METTLWAAKLERELSESEQAVMMRLLPPERRARLERVHPSRRREALCAWTLLRRALWEELGWENLPRLALTERGKPWFPDCPGVWFSLSHTPGAVLAGLSDAPVGVDIERIRPVRERVMRKVNGVETPEEFFRHWTALEALGKRSGQGIMAMLDEGREAWRSTYTRQYALLDGYAAAAAVSPGRRCPDWARVFRV